MAEARIEAHGQSYLIEVDPESRIGGCIVEGGKPYESPLLEHIYELGKEGVALDIGAHIGNHALWLAAVCGLSVVAFEPATVEELRRNVALNGLEDRVRVEAVALSDFKGVAQPIAHGRLDIGYGEVEVRRLDSYELQGVSVVKIDVEDMEPSVLRGGQETICRDRPVIFAEARDQACHDAIAAVLEPWGYRMVERFHSRGVATPVERWDG